jgi:hypothetical protein
VPYIHLLEEQPCLVFHSSELHQDSADVLFFPEKDDKSEVSHVYWAAKPRPIPFPLSKASANKSMFENEAGKTTTSGKLDVSNKANKYRTSPT